jgi:hypothetical protein
MSGIPFADLLQCSDYLIIKMGVASVAIHRVTDADKFTGAPQTNIAMPLGVINQLATNCRGYSFFH